MPNENPDYSRSDLSGRRAMKYDIPPFDTAPPYNSLRQAVPGDNIYEQLKWNANQPKQNLPSNFLYTDDVIVLTHPSPVTPRAGPARPNKAKIIYNTRPSTTTTRTPFIPSRTVEVNVPKSIDEEMEIFKEKLMGDTMEGPG